MNKTESLRLTAAQAFILAAGFLLAFWKSLYDMGLDWYTDPNYSHGFLIPLISLYMVWQKREAVKRAAVDPSNAGLFLLLGGLSLFVVGYLSGEYFTMRISMLIALAGAIIFCWGMPLLREIAFPYGFLFFMVPLPYVLYDSFAFPLKLLVSAVSVWILQIIGIPVFREGNIITLPATTLEVAEACSGMRSIMSLLALAGALAYFAHKGWFRKAFLILLAVPIAIAANAVRVIVTGILASRYGRVVAEGFFHEFAGLVIFFVATAMLLLSSFILARVGRR